jgi:hypothetical protein
MKTTITLICIIMLVIAGCSNEREIETTKNDSTGSILVIDFAEPSVQEQLKIYIDEVERRGITIKVIDTPDESAYWQTWFPNECICPGCSYKEPIGETKIYCNWRTDFVIRYLKYVIYYYDKHQEYVNSMKCNPDLESLMNTKVNQCQGDKNMNGRNKITLTGDMPIMPTGLKEKPIKHDLDSGQIAFIQKCKIEGKFGCTLTINNQPVYVSFYENAPHGKVNQHQIDTNEQRVAIGHQALRYNTTKPEKK